MSRTNPRIVVAERQGILGEDPDSRTRRVRVLSKLLDNSLLIPGTGWRIGFDPLVGLIPGIGDLIGAVLSGYIVLEAARAEVPPFVLARMLLNIGVDTMVGAVPALGDVFDAAWKANTKNVSLIENHLSRAPVSVEKRGVAMTMILAVLALIVIVAAGLALGIFVARLLWGLVTG